MLDEAGSRTGTQTIERAVGLLRYIATHQHDGCRLSTLAQDCGLRKSTAHRMLACLIREGLVLQRPDDRRYMLGPMLFELGLSAAPERLEIQHAARVRLSELARITQGVVKLFFRSGDDFVCSVRMGDTRMATRGMTIFPGTRRPLLYSAGGVAILLALPRREAFDIVRRNLRFYHEYAKGTEAGIRRMIRRSVREGIAINEGDIVPGLTAIGLPLCHANGEPFGSISMAGPQDVIRVDRTDEYRELIEDAARHMWARTTLPKPGRRMQKEDMVPA